MPSRPGRGRTPDAFGFGRDSADTSEPRSAAVVGSLRDGSYTRPACRHALAAAAFDGAETDCIDFRELSLSVFDEFEDATVGLLCVVERVEVLGWRWSSTRGSNRTPGRSSRRGTSGPRTDTDGRKNANTTQEEKADRRRERRITPGSVSFDFVHQYDRSRRRSPARGLRVGRAVSRRTRVPRGFRQPF